MPNNTPDKLNIENAQLIYRNFSGKAGRFNAEGQRSFSVVIDAKDAAALSKIGWNVKTRAGREEGDDDWHYLPVKVSYRFKEPKVMLITERTRTYLNESEIGMLDWADILTADIVITPSIWTNPQGGKGISAYLSSLYVTIEEDVFAEKYEQLGLPFDPDESHV